MFDFLLDSIWANTHNIGMDSDVSAQAAAVSALPVFRVYLKTHDVTGSEEFSRCARHFFAEILTYFKEK